MLDHTREKRRQGGTALLFRDSVGVHKIDAGNRTSYEFSEWQIHLTSAEKMRVVVVYRPPYSGEHKVPTHVGICEPKISHWAIVSRDFTYANPMASHASHQQSLLYREYKSQFSS